MKEYIDKIIALKNSIQGYITGIPSQFYSDQRIPFYRTDQLLIKAAVFFAIALIFSFVISLLSLSILIFQYMVHEHPSIIAIKISHMAGVMPPVIIASLIILIGICAAVRQQLNKSISRDMKEWLDTFRSDFEEYQSKEIPKTRYEFMGFINLAYKEREEVTSHIPPSLEYFN